MFLRSLSRRITRPVMPDDEAMDFLVTQAIADFLATESSTSLDCIFYPSIQAAGNASNVGAVPKGCARRTDRLDARHPRRRDVFLLNANATQRLSVDTGAGRARF